MFHAFLAGFILCALLLISEFLWRKNKISGENARKFVHIFTGTIIAFLPFWVGYRWITLLAVGFVLVNCINRFIPVFHAINGVSRKTWGDILLGLSVLLISLLKPNKWLFAGAVMQVALADGMAAVIGVKYAKGTYKILGNKKSYIGTATFFLLSWAIVLIALLNTGSTDVASIRAMVLISPLVLTAIENLGVYGLDNLILPLGFIVLAELFT